MNNHTVHVQGNVANPGFYASVEVVAARPIDRMTAYAGSGLPYPCAQIAFDGTPNTAVLDSGIINVTFRYPNSYYAPDAKVKVPPSIFFVLRPASGGEPIATRFDLPDILPTRSLTYRPNFDKGPMFYSAKEELIGIKSAEETMRLLAQYKGKYDIA